MGILDGKKLLITGVLTDDSLAFGTARLAQEEGAEIVLTGMGRGLSLTKRVANKLKDSPEVLELDVNDSQQLSALADSLQTKWGRLDGALHAIAFGPKSTLGSPFIDAPWEDVSLAVQTSAYSLKALSAALLPLFRNAGGGSVVGLDFDATVAWPAYNWMGVSKAALESVARYLARDLGPDNVRVNLVAAGPVRTVAAKAIPGFSTLEDTWAEKSPLGWNVNDSEGVAKACAALLSDWFPQTTGEIVHVDGGFHAVGA